MDKQGFMTDKQTTLFLERGLPKGLGRVKKKGLLWVEVKARHLDQAPGQTNDFDLYLAAK